MVTSSEQQLLAENEQLKQQVAKLEHEGHQTRMQLTELDQLYRTAPVGLCFVDNDLRYVRINHRLAAFNGYTVEEHIGKHIRDVIPEIASEVELTYRRVIESGKPELDVQVAGKTSASQNDRSYQVSYYPVEDGHGTVVGASAVVQDITEREEAEREIQRSSELLRQIVSVVPHTIFWKDRNSVYLGCNERAAQDLGFSKPEDIIGKTDFETCVTQEQAEYFVSCDRQVMQSGERMLEYEERQQRPDGTEAILLTSKVPLRDAAGEIIGVLGVYTDITARKGIEQALQESEHRLRTVIDHAPEAILVLDADTGRFVDVNENAERLYGLDRDALTQVGPVQMSPPTQPDGCPSGEFASARIAEALAGHVPVFEWVHRNVEGQDVPCEIRLVRLPMTGRNLVRGSVTDITERKQAQQALQRAHDELEERVQQRTAELARSQQRFELAVKGTSEGIWDWDIATGREWWSDHFHSLLGYETGEIEAKYQTFRQLLHPQDRAPTLSALQAHLETRVPYDGECRLRTKSGEYRWFRSQGQAVWDETGTPVRMAGSLQDITDRKQAEAQLQAEQQLLRRLIDLQEEERRMVAHDIHDGFVQDVVGAHFHVQNIKTTASPDANQATAQRVASLLQKAIAEGRRLIRDLRPMVLDEEGVIEAIRHLLAEEKAHGGLAVDFDHDVRFGRLEPRLEGVIFRIVQEALNNVKRHGQTDHAAVRMTQDDDLLEVVVRDHGVGFDLDTVTLQSFGLRGICERARLFGGTARIESTPGDGTTVFAQLPVNATPPAGVAAE